MEMVMDNFQRLLETPFRWLAGLGGRLLRLIGQALSRRQQRSVRRKYMNG